RAARTGSPLEDLSDRELEVFNLIGQGHGTRQIAEELHLSIKTIESHRAHIKEKLNLKNATELVQHAIQWREVLLAELFLPFRDGHFGMEGPCHRDAHCSIVSRAQLQ